MENNKILPFSEVEKLYNNIKKGIEQEGSFQQAYPLGTAFYHSVSPGVTEELPPSFYFKVHTFLQKKIQEEDQDFLQIFPLMSHFYFTMKNLTEREDSGTVSTDDERTAEKMAKRGLNVQLTKEEEQEELEQETQTISSSELEKVGEVVQSTVLEGLRNIGEEISSAAHSVSTPNEITITVNFSNKEQETWKFEIRDQESLVLVDTVPEEVLTSVDVLPSGEVSINKPLLIDNLHAYFNKKYISEEEQERNPHPEYDTHATKNYDDVEAGIKEKYLNIGHDDEARMMKQTAYEIIEYGQKLYHLFDIHTSLDKKVNYPHWFQSLVIRGRDYIGKAGHYLEFKQKELEADYDTYVDTDTDTDLHEKLNKIVEQARKEKVITGSEERILKEQVTNKKFTVVSNYIKTRLKNKS